MNFIDIDNNKLNEMMKNEDTLLIDIRTKEEFEEKHIKNAINIPLHDLMYNIDDIEEFKEKNVVVYCRSGHRSIIACNLLGLSGFDNLYNLKSGILSYKN